MPVWRAHAGLRKLWRRAACHDRAQRPSARARGRRPSPGQRFLRVHSGPDERPSGSRRLLRRLPCALRLLRPALDAHRGRRCVDTAHATIPERGEDGIRQGGQRADGAGLAATLHADRVLPGRHRLGGEGHHPMQTLLPGKELTFDHVHFAPQLPFDDQGQ